MNENNEPENFYEAIGYLLTGAVKGFCYGGVIGLILAFFYCLLGGV